MNTLIDSKKIMAESRVVLSKEVREILDLNTGDILNFVEENGRIFIKKAEA